MSVVVLAMATMFAIGAAPAKGPLPRQVISVEHQPARASARWARAVRGRAHARVEPTALAAWCDALARALRAGITLRHALRTVAPPDCVARQLAPVVLALERGTSVSAALADVHTGAPDLDLVVVVLRACAEHGGASAEPIDRAAAALRQRAALAGERRTNSAQARMSALVMTCLPGAMLVLLMSTSHSVRGAATSPAGLAALGAGIALNATGWGWMRRLIARATR
jgi:tight adherence protein B